METVAVVEEPEPVVDKETDKAADSEPSSVGELAALVEANPTVVPSADESADPPEPEREIAEGPLAAEPVGIEAWLNSDPLTLEQLRGKVVLVDFWTYTLHQLHPHLSLPQALELPLRRRRAGYSGGPHAGV